MSRILAPLNSEGSAAIVGKSSPARESPSPSHLSPPAGVVATSGKVSAIRVLRDFCVAESIGTAQNSALPFRQVVRTCMSSHRLRTRPVAATFLVIGMVVCAAAVSADEKASPKPRQPVTAEQALEMLKAGNQRFVRGESKHPHESDRWRRKLVDGQKPIATILGCSDSRVSPELIFDEGLGDLFVIRVAGNIVDEDVTASIEYAVEHLDTHLVVVLGHEHCGAVTAAMKQLDADEPKELSSLVKRLHDSIFEHHDGEPDVTDRSEISTAVCKNVMCGARELSECPDLCVCMKKHKVKIVGAVYDLETGQVRWID